MRYAVDAQTMNEIDRYSMEEVGIPSMVLMEKAAMKLVSVITSKIAKSDKILAVCGMGTNGGDGVAAARMLWEDGYQAEILLVGDKTRASEQMKQQLRIAGNLGMSVYNSAKISEYTVIIDSLFGVGLKRNIEGNYAQIIQEVNDSKAIVFSVDLPSGIDGTTGKILGIAIRADYTVTFGYHKIGLILFPGCEYTGDVIVADIGFPRKAMDFIKNKTFYYEKEDLVLMPERRQHSNKGTYGKVLVIAGSESISGAAYLSAKAAYRTGAGLVKVLTPECNKTVIQTMLPEALVSTYSPNENSSYELDEAWLKKEMDWATVIAIGPGIGVSEISRKMVLFAVENITKPLIFDADSINLLANEEKYVINDEITHSTVLHLPSNVILTPHLKEMSRLTKLSLQHIISNMYEVAEQYRGDYVLVLKDARTIVIDEEHMYINVSGNHGMATGGSGDVLAGIIAGLLAQGMSSFDAASLGVYIHGLAGDYAVKKRNHYSVMAGDIVDALSYILQGCADRR